MGKGVSEGRGGWGVSEGRDEGCGWHVYYVVYIRMCVFVSTF